MDMLDSYICFKIMSTANCLFFILKFLAARFCFPVLHLKEPIITIGNSSSWYYWARLSYYLRLRIAYIADGYLDFEKIDLLILAIFCCFANDCKLNVFQTWPAPPFSSTGWRVSTCPITTRQLFTVCLKLSRFSTLKDFCNFVPPGFPRPRLRHTWNMQAGEFSSFFLFLPLFVTSNLSKVFSQSSW